MEPVSSLLELDAVSLSDSNAEADAEELVLELE